MYASSIACRIEYTWNGTFMPISPDLSGFGLAGSKRPNRFSVRDVGVAALTLTSTQTPPNARLLLCAFPAILVFPQRLRGRWYVALMVLNVALFFSLTWFTFVGVDFRP